MERREFLIPIIRGLTHPRSGFRVSCLLGVLWFVRDVQNTRSHALVVGRWVMFGVVISLIARPWCPFEGELLLSDFVADPMIPHVNGARFSLLDGVVADTVGC